MLKVVTVMLNYRRTSAIWTQLCWCLRRVLRGIHHYVRAMLHDRTSSYLTLSRISCLLLRFSPFSHSVATNTTVATSLLPVELWERIIDILEKEPEALCACETVCKQWYPRSHFHLRKFNRTPRIHNQEEAQEWARYFRAVPQNRNRWKRVTLRGDARSPKKSLAHLGTFAAVCAGHTHPRLQFLHIEFGSWEKGSIPSSAFLHLTTLTSIRELYLSNVTFPSVSVLGRLVCALHGLRELRIEYELSFIDDRLPAPSKRWVPPPSLSIVRCETTSSNVLFALVASKISSKCNSLQLQLVSTPLEAIESNSLQAMLWSAGKNLRVLEIDSPVIAFLQEGLVRNLIDHHFNLSKNTRLKELIIPVFARSYEDRFHWINTLISHLASGSLTQIEFPVSDANLDDLRLIMTTFCTDCGFLDTLLCRKKFKSLVTVLFKFEMDVAHKADAQHVWLHIVQPSFPRLHQRGVLRAQLTPRKIWLYERTTHGIQDL